MKKTNRLNFLLILCISVFILNGCEKNLNQEGLEKNVDIFTPVEKIEELELPSSPEEIVLVTHDCIDSFGNTYSTDELLQIYHYDQLSSQDGEYFFEKLNFGFEYLGPEFLYVPTGLTGEILGLSWDEILVRFSYQSDVNCVDDSIQAGTQIRFHEQGKSEAFVTVDEWMNVISQEWGDDIDTVILGDHSYQHLRTRNMGSGLVDYYWLRQNNDTYVFVFAWLGERKNSETWWLDEPTPLHYLNLLETVKFF